MNAKFLELYDYIVLSNDTSKMEVLGKVLKELMSYVITTNKPKAEELLDKLEAVKWRNYLTQHEALNIVQNMQPAPTWTIKSWEAMLETRKWPLENMPFYNKWALYTTMQMICSDSGSTLKDIITLASDNNSKNDSLFEEAVYQLAIDKLVDKDNMFNIRKYFNL